MSASCFCCGNDLCTPSTCKIMHDIWGLSLRIFILLEVVMLLSCWQWKLRSCGCFSCEFGSTVARCCWFVAITLSLIRRHGVARGSAFLRPH